MPNHRSGSLHPLVNRAPLEDLEAEVLAARALRTKLRILDVRKSFGEVVVRGRP